jgi:hypothetical protein
MIEFVILNDDGHELWEIDYEKKTALNVSDLAIVKNKVSNHQGTIQNFLKQKDFSEMHFQNNSSLPSREHYKSSRNCTFR